MKSLLFASFLLAVSVNSVEAQHRHVNLKEDRKIAEDNGWVYNNLDKALKTAKSHNMPIMVVIRCPP